MLSCGKQLRLLLVLLPAAATVGPPYITDDPVPVELHHWEVYLASQRNYGPGGADGERETMSYLAFQWTFGPR